MLVFGVGFLLALASISLSGIGCAWSGCPLLVVLLVFVSVIIYIMVFWKNFFLVNGPKPSVVTSSPNGISISNSKRVITLSILSLLLILILSRLVIDSASILPGCLPVGGRGLCPSGVYFQPLLLVTLMFFGIFTWRSISFREFVKKNLIWFITVGIAILFLSELFSYHF